MAPVGTDPGSKIPSEVIPYPDHTPPRGRAIKVSGIEPLQYTIGTGGIMIAGIASIIIVVDVVAGPHSLWIVRVTGKVPGLL